MKRGIEPYWIFVVLRLFISEMLNLHVKNMLFHGISFSPSVFLSRNSFQLQLRVYSVRFLFNQRVERETLEKLYILAYNLNFCLEAHTSAFAL